MRGIQKYTAHKKTGDQGTSVSIIFRKLSPFVGDKDHADGINLPVEVPWDNLDSMPSLWKRDNQTTENDIPMVTTWSSRLAFNLARRHICTRQMLSTSNNIIQSMLLTSPSNIVSPDANNISVLWPKEHTRTQAMINTMNEGVKFPVFCSKRYFGGLPADYLYCGQYIITSLYHTDCQDYYLLIKDVQVYVVRY